MAPMLCCRTTKTCQLSQARFDLQKHSQSLTLLLSSQMLPRGMVDSRDRNQHSQVLARQGRCLGRTVNLRRNRYADLTCVAYQYKW